MNLFSASMLGFTLLFVGLKLGGVIDWSYWLVLAPLYGPLAVLAALIAAVHVADWRAYRAMTPQERAAHDAREALAELANRLVRK